MTHFSSSQGVGDVTAVPAQLRRAYLLPPIGDVVLRPFDQVVTGAAVVVINFAGDVMIREGVAVVVKTASPLVKSDSISAII